MIVSYSDKDVIVQNKPSIFLAGPTPRSLDVKSWRPQALQILKELNFDGVVYVPEPEYPQENFDYNTQVMWERKGLKTATVIAFWIPRDLKTMPAFTTNVEFGYYIRDKKILYGRPENSEKNRYLDWLYEYETNLKPIYTLQDLMKNSMVLAQKKSKDHLCKE